MRHIRAAGFALVGDEVGDGHGWGVERGKVLLLVVQLGALLLAQALCGGQSIAPSRLSHRRSR